MEFRKYVVLLDNFLIECESKTCVRSGAVGAWHPQNFRTSHGILQKTVFTPDLATIDFEVPNTPRDPFFGTDGTHSFKFLMHTRPVVL